MENKKIDVNISQEEISDEIKDEMKEADEIHIHKIDEDGKKIDIDIDKKYRTVDVNVDKYGKKQRVRIGLSGIKIEDKDGKKINIQFFPIFSFVVSIVSIFLFFNTFSINMILQYKQVGKWKDYLYGERAYIWLSLLAKTCLAWQVFFGTYQPN